MQVMKDFVSLLYIETVMAEIPVGDDPMKVKITYSKIIISDITSAGRSHPWTWEYELPLENFFTSHRLINNIDTKAKCHIKKLTCKGTLRQMFIRV